MARTELSAFDRIIWEMRTGQPYTNTQLRRLLDIGTPTAARAMFELREDDFVHQLARGVHAITERGRLYVAHHHPAVRAPLLQGDPHG